MDYEIEKVNLSNYNLFDDMVFWREHGFEREPSKIAISEQIKKELQNPNLYIYVVKEDCRYIGWISLIYMPKVGRWKGHGHVYIDELWIQPRYRGQGLSKILMNEADRLMEQLDATGRRLYVNINNSIAEKLYKNCGYKKDSEAYFMEK